MTAQTSRLEPHDSTRIAVLTELLLLQLQVIGTITVASDPNRVVPPAAPGVVALVLTPVLLRGRGLILLKTGIAEAMTHTDLLREADRGALAEQEGRTVHPLRTTIVTTALVPQSATARVCSEVVAAVEVMTDSPAQKRFAAGHHAGF